jgi:hypothetical protein
MDGNISLDFLLRSFSMTPLNHDVKTMSIGKWEHSLCVPGADGIRGGGSRVRTDAMRNPKSRPILPDHPNLRYPNRKVLSKCTRNS